MPRVREIESHIQPVTVTGQIFGAPAGQVVLVTLERQCTWRGQLVPMRMETRTVANGEFRLALPASAELATVDGAPVSHYELTGPGLQRVRFVVPAGSSEWRLTL